MTTASFADIAVSVSLVTERQRLSVADLKVRAMQLGVSDDGIAIAMAPRELEIAHLEQLLAFMKDVGEIEPQVRALIARRKYGRWPSIVRSINQAAAMLV